MLEYSDFSLVNVLDLPLTSLEKYNFYGGTSMHRLLQALARSDILSANIDLLQILQNALHTLGYPAITIFILIESAGIPFPGETMLLLASFYAAIDHQLHLPIIIACAAIGTIVGDNLGYYLGRTGGKTIIERYGHRIFLKPEHLKHAETFFAKHGDKTVFLGRFVAILRTWSAFLAGVNRMHWRTFLIYNTAGGILWATLYGVLGYYTGRFLHDNFSQIEHLASTVTWTLGTIIVIGACIVAFMLYRKHKKQTGHME